MPVAPSAGVPPAQTLNSFDKSMANFTPTYIAPGLTHKNFFKANGLVILASIVALLLLILFFLDYQFSGPPTIA